MSDTGIASPDGLPVVFAEDRDAWRAWLAENHAAEKGAWLVLGKKGSGLRTVNYEEAVLEAVAFGWIDSRANRVDETRYIQLFTPRKPGSMWSNSNRERVDRLVAEGRMTPAGMALVDAAKAGGTWLTLETVQANEIPDDLAEALAANEDAGRHFAAFPPSSKRIILEWIASAKRPETRAKRIAETVDKAAVNIRANHYRQPTERS